VKKFKEFVEGMKFKVDIEGLPEIYMDGNSPSSVKAHLRKLVKQPSMIKSVDRVTSHDMKKTFKDMAQGKYDFGTPEATAHAKKITPGQ
jgi:hypothetical protein